MNIIRTTYNIFLDALFPLSGTEKELRVLTPASAYSLLPPAPRSPIERARGIFAYKDGRVAKLVWNIKYKKSAHAVSIGGYILFNELTKIGSGDGLIIIPMPITPRRLRERGFNQCDLLVDEIKRLDADNKFTVEKSLLVRVHHDSRQTLKGREDRLQSAKGIFAVNQAALKQYVADDLRLTEFASPPYKGGASRDSAGGGFKFIIIDDVITTGSTMKEAMDTLKMAGMENVNGLALAH